MNLTFSGGTQAGRVSLSLATRPPTARISAKQGSGRTKCTFLVHEWNSRYGVPLVPPPSYPPPSRPVGVPSAPGLNSGLGGMAPRGSGGRGRECERGELAQEGRALSSMACVGGGGLCQEGCPPWGEGVGDGLGFQAAPRTREPCSLSLPPAPTPQADRRRL